MFSQRNTPYFSDGETKTLERKRICPTEYSRDLSALPSAFSPICTTTQESCQRKYLPSRFTHGRPEMAPRGQILSRGRAGPAGMALRHPHFRTPQVISPHLLQHLLPHPPAPGGGRTPHLEMEDAGISILETLAMRNHSVQEVVIESEGGDGSQEPTVP